MEPRKQRERMDIRKEIDLIDDPNDKRSTEDRKKRANTKSKEETSEEKFMKVEISEEEKKHLKRVFNLFVGQANFVKSKKDRKSKNDRVFAKRKEDKEEQYLRWFNGNDVRRILNKLLTKDEYRDVKQDDIKIMIWEVDENLDEQVDSYEFELMYKKCIEDKTGLEAKNLFNLVQFLMFCKPPEDKDGKVKDIMEFNKTIKAEDTYSLIYGRLDRQNPIRETNLLTLLDEQIVVIFQDKDDPEIEIDYLTYLKRVYEQALNKRLADKKKDANKNKSVYNN